MNSKRIISLILSIVMTLQVFAFQTPVHAMEGVNPTTQKSEGQKIGKRSEVFEFKNNEKPKLSWFSTRSRSLFGAKDVGLTKSEKVKIETTTTGLDDGDKEFNWEAFGQNKKFEAWIEVSYVGEKDEKGDPIKHKVSENFNINAAGTINTNIVVDASKPVENYYILTEYDKEPDSFKINAFFDEPTFTSDKKTKTLTFKLGVHQIVSTKITYNLIDEYGKEIDLNDAKEEKPTDDDLKAIGKIGEDITFDLKKNGTENLWQEEGKKDNPSFDEWDLTSSSLALSLTKNEIKSNNIDYKLTSTYDVINGGKVTIKRQKDVVTPKDQHNPGNVPDGYARINLVADETGNGSKGTFTSGDTTDTTRVVDVRAGKPYTVAQAEVTKQGKPFPLTEDNKEDKGKTFKAWAPELSTLGTAVDKETKILNATYQASKVELIPYLPTDPVPTHDKDGLPIPTNYVTVTFKSESETKGKVKIDDKEGATVLAKAKPGIDLSQKTEITTVPAEHYGFTKWEPALAKAADGQTYTAYFVKSGEEIGEKDPIPNGWYRVTVSQDADSIQAGTVPTKYYPVEPGDKLATDKFPAIADRANEGYKDPAWYVGSDKVEKPYELAINSAIDFVARATELESHKITKDNGLNPVNFTAYKGDTMGEDFWKKGVKLKTADDNLQKLLDAAKVTDATTPTRTTEKAGEKTGTLKVTFKDGSTIDVQNQKLTVIDTKVDIDYDKDSNKDANAPRHKDEVVKGKIKSDEYLEGAKVEILDKDDKLIGITLAKVDGSFIAGTRELQAGETIKVIVTLPKAGKASEPVEKVVKLNADRLKDLLPIAKAQSTEFGKKQNAIIKKKLDDLNTAITEAEKLVDKNYKPTAKDTAENQTAIDNAVTALEEALKKLTANIPPTISGPKTHEIFVGEALDLKGLVDVTDGDGADDLVVENGSNVKVTAVKVDGQTESPVADLSTIKDKVGTYKITYTAKDKSDAEVTHEMTLTVKPRTTSAIEVTKDPSKMSYLITEKDGKAQLNLEGMTLNLVDNLGKKTPVQLTDKNVTFKVNGKPIKDGGDLTLADDVKFIEVEYKDGEKTLTAKTDGVLRVGPDYDKDGKDDRTQNFDPEKIIKLEVIKQPQLDYIAKDKSEDSKFKLNLEGMIVRMTDKAGKEKLAVVKDGKFYNYDEKDNEKAKEITQLTATPAHGDTLTPQTSDTDKGHNGSKVAITGPNNSKAETEPLKVFYDANKDGKPDYGQDQKTPAPSAMARNVGDNPQGTTVEGMATPGAVIKITNKDGTVLTTEPEKVVAGPDGKYTATVKPMLADGTEIKVTAKLGEMGESDPTEAKVFDDKNDNKQPDRDEGFNIAKATDIKFVDQPDLTYLVKTKETEVTFDGKDGKGKPIYLELSYKNGKKTESKIMTLEELMKDNANISVTPANGTKDKKENQTHELVGNAIEVKLKNVVGKQGATEDQKTAATATSTSNFAIEIDADGNKKADKDEQTEMPAIISARNVKNATQQDKIETKVKVKALVGSTITIKDENDKVISDAVVVPAKGNDKYNEVEITLKEKQDAGKKVQAIAKLGEKQDSEPAESIVFQDLDGDNKPDGQGELDIANIVEFKLASNPDKMKYPLKAKDAQETLDLTGLMVYLKDKNGNTGIFEYNKKQESPFEELKGNDKFKLELVKDQTTKAIDENTKLSTADDLSKVKVTLQIPNSNGQGKVDGKSVETSQLEVFLDANGDGERDTNQTPAPKDLKALNKGNDAFTTITGKAQAGDVIKVYDEDGKEITTDPVTVTAGNDGTFTIKVSKDSKALPKDSLVFVTAQADKKDESPRTPVVVKVDADGSGTADSDETTTIKSVIARNIGTGDPKQKATFTTIEGVAEKGSKVTITFTEKGKQEATTKTVDADANTGAYKLELNNPAILLDAETVVKATAKYGEKKDSPTIDTKVFDDLNADGKDDKAAEQKSKMPQNVRAMNQNKVGQDGKVTNEAKDTTTVKGKVTPGAIVKITSEDGKDLTPAGGITVDKTSGEFTAEIAKQDVGTEIKVTATEPGKLESDAAEAKVFRDADNNEADDSKATTERPSALAYNFKDEAKTTIKGETEPWAKVVAKVGDTEVGTATAGADGKYEISATKDGAKLPKGTKVSVTAKLDPKGTSPAQETVVYDDLDGDGQPDTSQDFDKDKIRGLEVVASPDKMVYNNKEQLDLTGMKVLLTDQMGNMKIVKFSEFETYGIKVNPLNKTELSDKNVADGGHNGQKIKAEVKVAVGNTEKTYSGETPTALTVNKDQSAQPTDVLAANQGDKPTTTVKGKAKAGAKVEIKNSNDKVIGTVDEVPANGEFEVEVTKQAEKAKIKVTATEAGKTESAPQEATVFRDKNGDWKDDAGNIKLTAPDFEDVKVGDKSVKVEIPTDPSITKIIVQDQAGNKVEATKEMEGEEPNKKPVWKVNGKPVEKDGKLDITTDQTLKFGPNQIVKVIVKDAENNEGSKTKAVQPANLPKMPDPIPDSLSTQDTKVTGKSVPGAIVKVQLPGQTEKEAQEALVKSDGSFEFVLPNKLADKDKVVIIAESPGKYEGTGKATVTVGLNLKELENTNREADKLISDSKTGNNFDPENNKYDKNLEEKSKKAKDVLEKAKDKDDNNDPTQTKVDDAEKELRKAIAEKIADTAVDKAKDNPTPSNIEDAQKKIDAIPGSTNPKDTKNFNPNKKELQDKLDLIKKIKEGEDRLKQDDVTGANDTPTKPQEDIDKLKKAIQDGKDALNNNEKGKYGEKTTEIEKAINILNQDRIYVKIDTVTSGDKTFYIKISVPYAKIKVTINGKVISKSKVINKNGELVDVDYVTADPFGNYTMYFGNINEDGYDFTNGLSEDDVIIIEATKDGYNPGEYRETIY